MEPCPAAPRRLTAEPDPVASKPSGSLVVAGFSSTRDANRALIETASNRTPAPRRTRVGRLDTVTNVRRELVRVYVEARQGRLDVVEASRLGNILAIIGRLIEGADLEPRIAELERARQRDELR